MALINSTTINSEHYAAGSAAVGSNVSADLIAIIEQVDGNIESQNLANNAVVNAKIANNAVNQTKISSDSVRETHLDYASVNSGPKVWRANGYLGADGGKIAVVSKSLSFAATTHLETFTWSSDCPDGNPNFSDTPRLIGAPAVIGTDASDNDRIDGHLVHSIASNQAVIKFWVPASTGNTVVVEFGVAGPVTA